MAQGRKRRFNPANNLSREARSKGGQNSPRNFRNLAGANPEELKRISQKGGEA